VAKPAKPRVVVSKCLGFAPCRYDGSMIADERVRRMKGHVEFLPVCPEMEIGLGCPRESVRVVLVRGRPHLIQPSTGRDVTAAMRRFAERFLGGLGRVDGFILKSRSPSCGVRDVKVYAGADAEEPLRLGAGLFAAAVLRRFPDAAVEDDERLRDAKVRRRFLGKLGLGRAGL
jgi:uncharacterized protein YbbK (DUF523 family)